MKITVASGFLAALLASLACGLDANPLPQAGTPAPPPAARLPAELAWAEPTLASAEMPGPVALPQGLRFPSDNGGGIDASFYFLASPFFSASEVETFLTGVRRMAPNRAIVAVLDAPIARAMLKPGKRLGLTLLLARSGPYSPWPRDPMIVTRDAAGNAVFVARPSLQPGREMDLFMAPELAAQLAAFPGPWGRPSWTLAPMPFHTGQSLATDTRLWLTVHSVELATLGRLKLSVVPVARFNTPAGLAPYFEAAMASAADLSRLYGRKGSFVHPWPRGEAEDVALVARLGKGAGFDLDSLLTLLPGDPEKPPAFVADVAAGRSLLARLSAEDWRSLERTYALRLDAPGRQALASYQDSARAKDLGDFLDLLASSLVTSGHKVGRLPLLLVPTTSLREVEAAPEGDFLIGWNNVVITTGAGRAAAEGFASGLPATDLEVAKQFSDAGVTLNLLPPLVASVLRNGGYRCASAHLRR
ncbi:MAG: hypothetical protein U0002_17605 [Thermoanaerobaculia bacterium]